MFNDARHILRRDDRIVNNGDRSNDVGNIVRLGVIDPERVIFRMRPRSAASGCFGSLVVGLKQTACGIFNRLRYTEARHHQLAPARVETCPALIFR